MPVLFYGYEQQFDTKEVQYQEGQTIKQIFQQLLQAQQIADEIGFQLSINNVIIVLKKDLTKIINLNDSVQKVMQQADEDRLELMIICPTEEGGVLIEYIVNKRYCYFENYVNKNDQLESFIKALCKRISFQKKYEIKVNGQKNSLKAPFQKKTIKQLIGTSSKQKIKVEINQVEKAQAQPDLKKEQIKSEDKQKQQQKEIAKKPKKQEIKISQKFKKQEVKQPIQKQEKVLQFNHQDNQVNIQRQKDAPNNNLVENQSKSLEKHKEQIKAIQKSKLDEPLSVVKPVIRKVAQQEVEEPSSFGKPVIRRMAQQKEDGVSFLIQPVQPLQKEGVREKPRNQLFLFTIKFQTNMGVRSQTYQTEKTKTMKEILPDILRILSEAGFDWDTNWKDPSDYQDKLGILYGKQQYKKYDAKFVSVLSTASKATHEFTFERLYEGG